MARTPQVPGAAKTTAAAKAAAAAEEAALEQQQNESSVASEPVPVVNQSEQEQSAPTNQELLEQIKLLKRQLIAQSNNLQSNGQTEPVAPRARTRDVVGPHGWTKEAI